MSSINSEINRIQTNVNNAFDVLENQYGVNVLSTDNSDQLATRISEIRVSEVQDATKEGDTVTITKFNGDEITIREFSDYALAANGYNYIDLGLPSGTLWATCNLGADSPTEIGDFYRWGETEARSSSQSHTWDSYFDSIDGNSYNFSKYALNKKTQLDLGDDAAHVKWGGNWRMPTREQWVELLNTSNCSWTFRTNYNGSGINGYEVKSRKQGYTNNFIFIAVFPPDEESLIMNGIFFWSSSLSLERNYYANCALISPDISSIPDYVVERDTAMPIRPVLTNNINVPTKVSELQNDENYLSKKDYYETAINGHQYVDLGLPSGTLWATCNVGAERNNGCGWYFMWGDPEPKSYYWPTYYKFDSVHINDVLEQSKQAPYSPNTNDGTSDTSEYLPARNDIANIYWGGCWRMPTKDEVKELVEKCTSTWTTQNGLTGKLITGPNGNQIFLPAAGAKHQLESIHFGTNGHYWTSTSGTANNYRLGAYDYDFGSDYSYYYPYEAYFGMPVRPVISASDLNSPLDKIELNQHQTIRNLIQDVKNTITHNHVDHNSATFNEVLKPNTIYQCNTPLETLHLNNLNQHYSNIIIFTVGANFELSAETNISGYTTLVGFPEFIQGKTYVMTIVDRCIVVKQVKPMGT